MTLTHTQTKTQTRDVEDMVNTAPSLTIDVPAGASEARMVINNRINALHPDNYEIRDYPTGDGWSFFVYGPNYTHVYNLKGN